MILLSRVPLGARQLLAFVFIAASLLGSSGSARAALSCLQASGNPFLVGLPNGISPAGSGECFLNVGNANLSTLTAAFTANGFPNFYAGYAQVTAGSIIVPTGDVIGGLSELQLAPAAVQGQLVAFNLSHGLPAAFSDPFTRVEVFQSTLSGQVINQGTITSAPIAFNINNFTFPSLEGIWVSATTFTGASTGVVNSGLIAVNQGNGGPSPFSIPAPFTGPLTVTGIRLDAAAGNSWAVLNTNTITADSNYTGAAAAASAGGIGIQVTAPAGA